MPNNSVSQEEKQELSGMSIIFNSGFLGKNDGITEPCGESNRYELVSSCILDMPNQ